MHLSFVLLVGVAKILIKILVFRVFCW